MKKNALTKWMTSAVKRIKDCRSRLAVSRDVAGLFKDGRGSTELIHDAAMLVSEARHKLEIYKTKFDIWMAKQRRLQRDVVHQEYHDKTRVWKDSPTGVRGFKPREPKETDVKDKILSSPEYLKHKEVLAKLAYILEAAEKAYFKPLDIRSSMIMSLNKLVTRESPE